MINVYVFCLKVCKREINIEGFVCCYMCDLGSASLFELETCT